MEEQGATGFIGPKGSRGTTGFMVIYIYIYIYIIIIFFFMFNVSVLQTIRFNDYEGLLISL